MNNIAPKPGVFSHSTPRPDYPALKWHPETGECSLFNDAAEVPDGYLDVHPNNLAKESEKAATLPMKRKAIIAALKSGSISFDPQADAATLYDLLLSGVKAALTEQELAFDAESDDAPALLALFPKE